MIYIDIWFWIYYLFNLDILFFDLDKIFGNFGYKIYIYIFFFEILDKLLYKIINIFKKYKFQYIICNENKIGIN